MISLRLMSSTSVAVRQPKIFLVNWIFLPEQHVLDVGCGLGGAARFTASRYGCRVAGIDLTPEYVETATVLCGWVGLDSRISLHQGSALAMPFADRVFDRAYMLHILGMNIEDKAKLCSEVSRVLQLNSLFGIYDVMRTGDGELRYPVPWATTAASSAVAKPSNTVMRWRRPVLLSLPNVTGVILHWHSLINYVPNPRQWVARRHSDFIF